MATAGPSNLPSVPDRSPACSVQEASATAEEVEEPEPDPPSAPEHFSRALSVPKDLFDIYDTYQEWHFGSEADKVPPPKQFFTKKRDPRLMELIENKENIPLEDRFDKLVDYSEQVEADIDAAQDRNTLLFDDLGKAGEKIRKLKEKKKALKADKVRLEKILAQSRKQTASGQDSPLRIERMKVEGAACRTTMKHADQTSTVLKNEWPQPPAFRADQDAKLAELQWDNDRLRQENEKMRNALEQHQNEENCPEEPESHNNDQNSEEEQIRSTEPEVEVQGADVKMGGITTELWKPEVNWYFSVCWLDMSR
ncbi:hypothetical protein FPRO04_10581 [Fusarium proliferatum]|nr:hypothetical protein FPRO04_10581 [Fusarium proliferatum]